MSQADKLRPVQEPIAHAQVHDALLAHGHDVRVDTRGLERHDETSDGLARLALAVQMQRVDDAGHSVLVLSNSGKTPTGPSWPPPAGQKARMPWMRSWFASALHRSFAA